MRRLILSLTTVSCALAAVVGWGQPAPAFLGKPTAQALRVLTWNVYRNSIFPQEGQAVDVAGATRPAQFARVLRALKPDVICLQEVTLSARRSAGLIDQILPQLNGRTWQAHAALDTVIVSRFNISAHGEGRVEDGQLRRGHAIALIEAPDADLYMICAHFQSSDQAEDIALRQRQAEMIVSTIRAAKAGAGAVPLRARKPFVILGDFNAIPGAATFVDAIASGRAPQTSDVESAAGLDWDGSSLTDARPHHNVSRMDLYTWRNDLERFPPGILDRILYSDSVIASANQFVLDTTVMSYDELVTSGLRTIDVMRDPQAGIHDHFPLVIDLVAR
jgi:endonuclease/exonuclease/phosphatase family metal-dependent hydrolase